MCPLARYRPHFPAQTERRVGYTVEEAMVYFIQEGDDGPVKIGFSDNPARRLQELQVASAKHLNLIAVIEGDVSKERELQARFQEFRLSGEWFIPITEIFLYIDRVGVGALTIVECPICGMQYLPNIAEDVQTHIERHKSTLRGVLPYSLRELLKEHGWALARSKDSNKTNDGRRAVAFSWWARAREAGLPDEALDDYMFHQLEYIDALLNGDSERADRVYTSMKDKWGRYM
jgi:hypothetical protein